MGKFRQCLTELSLRNMIMAGYYSLTVLFGGKIFSIFERHVFVMGTL